MGIKPCAKLKVGEATINAPARKDLRFMVHLDYERVKQFSDS